MAGLGHIRKLWRDYYETVASWSNEALETDSENTEDHKCRPMDPQVVTAKLSPTKQKNEVRDSFSIVFLELRSSSHCLSMKQCPLVVIVGDLTTTNHSHNNTHDQESWP